MDFSLESGIIFQHANGDGNNIKSVWTDRWSLLVRTVFSLLVRYMLEGKAKTCLWLFWINLFIGAFTFGGGYIVVPMIDKYYVRKKRLFTQEELLGMAAIAQSAPGAIAVNLSALAGYRVAGVWGTLVSCLGAIIPPLVILSFVSTWYEAFSTNASVEAVLRGMQAAVTALIVDIVVDMWQMILCKRSFLLNLMVPGAFLASFVFHFNIAAILAVCCMLSLGHIRIEQRRERNGG